MEITFIGRICFVVIIAAGLGMNFKEDLKCVKYVDDQAAQGHSIL